LKGCLSIIFFRRILSSAGLVLSVSILLIGPAASDDYPLVEVSHEPSRYFARTASPTRARVCLNGNWEVKGDPDYPEYNYGLEEPAPPIPTDESPLEEYDWHAIRVPGWIKDHPVWQPWAHDMKLPGRPERYWYRRNISVPADWRGDQVVIYFEAASWLATVYLNGKFVGAHKGQATPFEVDITDACTYGGTDELWVSLVRSGLKYGGGRLEAHILENSHWHFAYGLWGDVFLRRRPQVHVANVFVQPSFRAKRLAVSFKAANQGPKDARITVQSQVLDASDIVLTFPQVTKTIKAQDAGSWDLTKSWSDPHLWTPDDPHMYILQTTVKRDGQVVDVHRERFGFRECWTEDGHIWLNGKKMFFHQKSMGWIHYYAYAHSRPFLRYYFRYLKAIGVNMVRTTGIWNESLYEIADEEGMMVKAQSGWHHPNPPFAADLQENLRRALGEWITRDRNHPSIVLWCADNETWPNAEAAEQIKYADRVMREYDPTRPVDHEGAFWGDLNQPERQRAYADFEIWNDHYADLHNSTAYLTDYIAAWARHRQRPLFLGEWAMGAACTNGEVLGGNDYYWRLAGKQRSLYPLMRQDYDRESVLAYLRLTVPQLRLMAVAGIEEWPTGALLPWPPTKAGPSSQGQIELAWDRLDTSGWKPQIVDYTHNRFAVNPGFFPDLPNYEISKFHRELRQLWSPVYTFLPDYSWAYRSGQTLAKDIAIINDSMADITARLTWQLNLERTDSIIRGRSQVQVAQGQRARVPVEIKLPVVGKRTDGQLRIRALVPGQQVPEYKFNISIFPVLEQVDVRSQVLLYDPVGTTASALADISLSVGIVETLSELPSSVERVIIGEGALADEVVAAAAELRDFVAAGGTVISLAQQQWNKWLPVRLTLSDRFQAVHAYPVATDHPLLATAGLNEQDFHHWHGHTGRLVRSNCARPIAGRVLPILESSIGLSEAPLLEIREGEGRYIICQLVLADRAATDPCAERMLRALCEYRPQSHRSVTTGYLGDEPTAQLLSEQLGLQTRDMTADTDWEDIDLLVTGGKPEQTAQIESFVKGGGTWLALAQQTPELSWLPDAPRVERSQILLTPAQARQVGRPYWRVTSDDDLLHQALRIDHSLTSGVSNADLYWQATPLAHFVMSNLGSWTALTEPVVMAVRDYGRGRIIVSTVNLIVPDGVRGDDFPRNKAQRVLNTLLINLGADVRDRSIDLETLAAEFFTVDIRKQANMALRDEVAGDKRGGWTDQGSFDMRNLPVGRHRFAGVPFNIIDAEQNDGKSCIVLLSSAHADFLPQKVTIPFGNRTTQRLYFLHTAAWSRGTMARYFINYAGVQEKKLDIPITDGENIADWTTPSRQPHAQLGKPDDMSLAQLGWKGPPGSGPTGPWGSHGTVGIWVFAWENPYPDEPIESISFVSEDKGPIMILLAVTAQ